MSDIGGRVIHIPQDDRKLHARIPILWDFLFPGVIQVQRGIFDVVAVREEKNPPMARLGDFFQHMS